MAGGLVLLGGYAWLQLTPATAPYHYQLVATGKTDEFPELDLDIDTWPDLTISRYDVYAEEADKPVAQAWFGERPGLPVAELHWANLAGETVLALDSKAVEFAMLAAAIKRYTAPDALLLSWWDTSRQLALLTERDVLFSSPLYEPLIIPSPWQNRTQAILDYESAHIGMAADAQEKALFTRYTQALVSPLDTGIAQLRELAGGREAYLIIHISDLFKLGLLYPDDFGIAYKHYHMTSNLHGMINHLKSEMANHGYHTYTLQSLSDELIRAFFLIDEADANTLLSQLLPFVSRTSPVELTTPKLVYQQGSYWVYQLQTTAEPDNWQPDMSDTNSDLTHAADQVQ